MALSADAKAELKEAIRIVREDRFEAYVRGRTPKVDPPGNPLIDPDDPPKTDPTDPKGPPVNPPPPKDEPPKDTPPKEPNRSRYWGELGDF